jgi:hypothetical protein
LSPVVNNVSLSPEQFRQFLAANPVKGLLLPAWVDAAYTHSIIQPMTEQLQIAALRGEGYAKIVRRLEDGFDQFSKRELTTLARTYMQESNVRATQAVFEANRDIMQGWIWTCVNDDRVCPLCLCLAENFYAIDEEHPPLIRHPRCRCTARAKTKTWRELGIDADELAPIEQAVVTRGYEKDGKWIIPPVGTGGAKIQGVQFYKGGIKEAFPNMPVAQQKAMIGPRRWELLQSGKITLDDLVDRRTGKLFTLKELEASKIQAFSHSFLDLKEKSTALKYIQQFRGAAGGEYTARAIEKAAKGAPTLIIKDSSGSIISAANLKVTKDAVEIDVLGSVGRGGGSEAIRQSAAYSKEIGKGGALELMPLGNAKTIEFYIKTGFDVHPKKAGKFFLSPEMARDMGYIK